MERNRSRRVGGLSMPPIDLEFILVDGLGKAGTGGGLTRGWQVRVCVRGRVRHNIC